MAERSGNQPTDPKLLRCQEAFKALSDEILKEKPDAPGAYFGLSIHADPVEILDRLKRSSLKDILLRDGESFSDPGEPNEMYPDLGLIAGQVAPHSITLRHGDRKYPKYRHDPDSPRLRPFKVKSFPGEYDWEREIALRFWYGNGKTSQSLYVVDCSLNAGKMPKMERVVYAWEYHHDHSYEGHNHKAVLLEAKGKRCFLLI